MQGREPFRALVEKAAAPELEAGAAERIADGAWERAAELRGAPGRGAAPGFRRRVLQIAAAAAVLAAAVIALRGSEPAFAVEGDAVQVRRGDEWSAARRVPVGSLVYVPQGARTSLLASDGTRVSPQPGALFRILAAAPRRTWRVELRSGDAEVSGDAFTLRLSDALEVAHAETDEVLRVVASLGAPLDAAPACIDVPVRTSGAVPRVCTVDGVARVSDLRGPDVLLLRPAEVAVSFQLGIEGRFESRLVRETVWSSGVAAEVLLGDQVVGAYPRAAGGFALALHSPDTGVRSVSIGSDACQEAISQLAIVAAQRAMLVTQQAAAPAVQVEQPAFAGASPTTSIYEHETAGRCTRILVRADGSSRLEKPGERPKEFLSLAALREAAPSSAALFGDRLR